MAVCLLVTGCGKPSSLATETAVTKETAARTVSSLLPSRPTLPPPSEQEGVGLPAFDTAATDGTLTYEELKAFLEQAVAGKDFCDEVHLLIWDTFENLYENYPSWMMLYHDMPARDRYVYENYVRIIDKLKYVMYYDETSQETQDLMDEGVVGTWVSCEDEGPYLHIVATPAAVAEDWERQDDIECFYHELTHIKQYNENAYCPFELWVDEDDCRDLPSTVIVEGGTSFHQRFVRPLSWELTGFWGVGDADATVHISYPSEICSGYLIWLSDYAKLTYLVGYDVMDRLERMEITYDDFLAILCYKYGYVRGRKYMKMVTERHYLYEESWYGEEVFQLSIDIENAFLALVQKDIEKAQTAEELDVIRQFYETYKRKNMPIVEIKEDYNELDRTEYFNIESVDKVLEERTKALANG